MKKLKTAAEIAAARPAGFYPVDGEPGLYLQVSRYGGGTKSYVFKFGLTASGARWALALSPN